ncbi:MAG: phage tail protein [Bacteroidales bacterium]|nr:phage tail protein [Bacteroidales bacterium]
METEYSKATEYGNYLSMDNQAFPIDCETLAALQNNTKKLAALGWIAGCNKLILIGCNVAGRERKEGYVFVVSSDNPLTGEVLYYKGGSSSEDKCHISEKTVNVTADGTDFPKAYSIRMLEDGVAGEPMNWADFGNVNEISNLKLFQSIKKEVSDITSVITSAIKSEATNRDKAISSAISAEVTNRNQAISSAISNEATNRDKAIASAVNSEATNRNQAISSAISNEATNRDKAISSAISAEATNRDKAITSEIQKISAFVKGMIIMWSGRPKEIPIGWALCDGQSGTPDLRSRFIVGAWDDCDVTDDLYEAYGNNNGLNPYVVKDYGGKEKITLSKDNLPAHSHNVTMEYAGSHWHYIYQSTSAHKVDYRKGSDNWCPDANSGTVDHDNKDNRFGYSDIDGNHKHIISQESVGKNTPFWILPPYYALCFIMKL